MIYLRLLQVVWLSGLLSLAYSPLTVAFLYEELPGQFNADQADSQRVPKVEFLTDPVRGSTLLKETDYVGEGQFPLVFTRYFSFPKNYLPVVRTGWLHSYSSCVITHYDRWFVENRTATVCTLGILHGLPSMTKQSLIPAYGYRS